VKQHHQAHTDDNMSGGMGAVCQTCHAKPTGNSRNAYGWQRDGHRRRAGIDEAITAAGALQLSDNDPTNRATSRRSWPTQPG
jgi:hypothetical protein